MSTSLAVLLLLLLWMACFLVVLPIRIRTQGESGKIEPGTPAGAPVSHGIGAKLLISALIAGLIWSMLYGAIASGLLTARDLDFFRNMRPSATEETR